MWFEIESLGDESNGNSTVARLMNAPYYVKELKKDKSYTIDLNNLTDWVIYTPDMALNTENIFIYPSKYLEWGQIS